MTKIFIQKDLLFLFCLVCCCCFLFLFLLLLLFANHVKDSSFKVSLLCTLTAKPAQYQKEDALFVSAQPLKRLRVVLGIYLTD